MCVLVPGDQDDVLRILAESHDIMARSACAATGYVIRKDYKWGIMSPAFTGAIDIDVDEIIGMADSSPKQVHHGP